MEVVRSKTLKRFGFYFKSGATQLALSMIAVPDPPPLSVFAQLRTACPKFCACYTISANNQWQCAGNPIEPAPSCSMALGVWLGGRRISSGRPRCGSLRAAAAAAPALPTCCNTLYLLRWQWLRPLMKSSVGLSCSPVQFQYSADVARASPNLSGHSDLCAYLSAVQDVVGI